MQKKHKEKHKTRKKQQNEKVPAAKSCSSPFFSDCICVCECKSVNMSSNFCMLQRKGKKEEYYMSV